MRGCHTLGWIVLAVLARSTPSPSQSPPPPPRAPLRATVLPGQWRPGVPASAALTVPAPITRDTQVQRVSLKEAIALALENNPGIAAKRLEPTRQGAGILKAQATFDPTLSGELISSNSITPAGSVLAGSDTLRTDDRSANFHLWKTFRTGTTGTIDFLNDRLDTNSRFNSLRPQYKPQLSISIVQPLLRNFGWDFSYLVVRAAEAMAEGAGYRYEADVADFVQQVIQVYWSVVGARENLEVQRQSKALADRTVEENEARVRVGLLPPVATLEARADAMSREDQVLIADNTLELARQQLAQLVYYRPLGTFVPRTVEPVEEAMPEDLRVDLDDTLGAALADRAEIHASAHGVTAQQLNERVAQNGLLPRLDVVGNYGVNGLSGRNQGTTQAAAPINGCECVANPCPFFRDRFGGACPVPITYTCTCPSDVLRPSPFVGAGSTAYDRLTNGDFRSYSFGLKFEVPFSNAQGESQLGQSRIARDQAELNHRELLSQVTLEARQTVNDVLTSRQRIDTTRVARELAEENLKNQQKRHEVGMATTKDLLDFQTRLTSARAAEVQAKIDHAIAVAKWRRARGALLRHYQIVIEHQGHHSAPWFARF